MASLTLCRGLPASGKSTWAQAWVDEDPENRVRVNRDDIRFELFGEYSFTEKVKEKEGKVTSLEHQRITRALSQNKDVVVDNTNLHHKSFATYGRIAKRFNIPLQNKDFYIPIEEAIRRNQNRDRVVPEAVIRSMADRYMSPKGEFHLWPGSHPIRPFQAPETRRTAVNFDADGTLVNVFSIRHLVQNGSKYRDFDGFHRYSLWSPPNPEVVQLAKDAHAAGYAVLVTTARGEQYRELTQKWLEDNDVPFENMYMRAEGDMRPDYIVKKEMAERIKEHYDVALAVDDNPQAIRAWQESDIRVIEIPYFEQGDVFTPITVKNPFADGSCVRCGKPLKNGGSIGPRCAKFA